MRKWGLQTYPCTWHKGQTIGDYHPLSISRVLLPLQIIFIRTTRILPPNKQRRIVCVANGWDLIYNENHWPNFDNTKHFVENVMVLYHQAQIELLGLQTHQKLVWLLHCWSIHKSQKFLDSIFFLIQIFLLFLFQQIVELFSNQLMSFCNVHSNMHSRWSSTFGQLGYSNNKLRVAKIPMLISKWTIWNHGSMSGYTMHGEN